MGNRGIRNQGKSDSYKPKEVWALHFECDLKDVDVVMPALQKIYSSLGERKFPLGIKLGLIPEFNKLHTTKNKVERLQN